ncbi:MAG: response regulator [Rubrivivax sp.]|jgi:two-component system response regulator QseB
MRLLIVEDDPDLGDAVARGLRQAGHAVDWFTDGAQADAALQTAGFDAIVLDLGLPGRDGMHWLARWRQQGRDVPVLILTARDAVAQRIAGLDAGADDYLVKPIAIDELAARLRALSRRAAGRPQSVWTHGPLTFDPASRQATWQGVALDLTGREAALLEVLLQNPQRVLTRQQIVDKLYDWQAAEPESNALEVHVHHLRRKTHARLIRTVRGLGYALGAADGLSDD